MVRPFKFYPDLWLPRLGFLVADLLMLGWIALWIVLGAAIHNAVTTLNIIANGVIATGDHLNDVIGNVQSAVNNLPVVGGGLHDALTPLNGIPSALIAQGHDELQAIESLAITLASIMAGVPLLLGLFIFIPWRLRKTRGFRSLEHILRQPGAHSVATTMQVLAGRALYTLPYERLLSYSPDPIAEWREGRYYNLARATMAEEGLDVRRYLRRLEGIAPAEMPVDLPTVRDE